MYDQSKLIQILKMSEFKCIYPNGKCLPPANPIYFKISEKMKKLDSFITPKHVYTIMNENRRGIASEVLKEYGIDTNNINNSLNDSEISSFQCSFESDEKKCSFESDTIFRLIISEKNWDNVKPMARQYSNRRYLILKPGEWSNIFAAKIWEQTKIPCAFTFKKAAVFPSHNAKCFVRFYAICKECKAKLTGKMMKKPNDGQDAIFDCTLINFDNQINHIKKRQLKGSLRQKVAGHLIDAKKQATIWRNEEANKIMEFGDKSPPILFSAHVLRKAKQNELDNRLGISDCDPIRNLQIYKYVKRPGSIHGIGLDPFYVMYWSTEQLTMYKIINRSRNAYFTMDATGSIAKKLPIPDGTKSSHLFLYQCVIVPEGKRGIPVFQMISTKQDAALLTYFLLEIRRAGAAVPCVTVTDFSRAILVALARAFADCADLKHYLERCYDVVVKNKETTLPGSYLRLDVSHVIKIISNWECLRHLPNKVRQFYLRCIAQAYQMQSMEELTSFLTSILAVALSEDVGHADGTSVPAETCLQFANNCIKGVHLDDYNATDIVPLDDITNSNETPLSWQEWSNSLYAKANELATQSKDGTIVNAFYNPAAAMKIKILIQNLPLWTGVMRPYFKTGTEVPTSSSVESIFAEYKTRLFKGCLPMRIDKFVANHLDYLDGRLRLDYAANASSSGPDCKSKQNQINIHESDPNIKLDVEMEQELFENSNSCHNLTSISNTEVTDNSATSKANSTDESYNYSVKVHSKSISISDSATSNETCSLNLKENWMGLAEHSKKSGHVKKETYLDKCPEWDSIESHNTVCIPIIKNGSICQPVKLKKETIMVRNTCAFDALLHCTLHMIGMNSEYKQIVQNIKDCNFLQLAIKIISRGKITKNEYVERASFLASLSLFQQENYTRRFQSLDAMCNAAHLAEYTYALLPSLKRQKICLSCHYTNERKFTAISINVNILLTKGLGYIQDAINDTYDTKQTCPKCQNQCKISEEYGPHVIIDTSVLSDPNYIKSIGLETKLYNLEGITKNVTVGNRKYILRGIVNYINNAAHYTAIIYTTTSWYEYDDLKSKRQQVSPHDTITPHVLLYAQL